MFIFLCLASWPRSPLKILHQLPAKWKCGQCSSAFLALRWAACYNKQSILSSIIFMIISIVISIEVHATTNKVLNHLFFMVISIVLNIEVQATTNKVFYQVLWKYYIHGNSYVYCIQTRKLSIQVHAITNKVLYSL